jgi:hypothetical protein
LLNTAKNQGLLTLPLALNQCQDFPIHQYADDTLIFIHVRRLFFLKALLHTFAESKAHKVVDHGLHFLLNLACGPTNHSSLMKYVGPPKVITQLPKLNQDFQ